MPPQRSGDHVATACHMQHAARTRDRGVEQFAAEHAAVGAGELQPDFVELAALRLVHGHGEGGFVRGERGGVEGADRVAAGAGEPGQGRAFGIRQADADVAVEQAVVVAVAGDQQQAAGEPRRRRADAAAGERGFDALVEGARALRALAQRGEQAQAIGFAQGVRRVCVRGERAPVREQIGVRLQRVVRPFVEEDVAEAAAAQQPERLRGVAVAYGFGQGRQVQVRVLAPAAVEVDAGAVEGRGFAVLLATPVEAGVWWRRLLR